MFYGTHPLSFLPRGMESSGAPASSPAFPGEGGLNSAGVAGGQNSGMGPSGMAEADAGASETQGEGVMLTRDGQTPVLAQILGQGRLLVPQGVASFAEGDEVQIEGSAFEIDSLAWIVDGSAVLFLAPTEE
ncbi:MAG: hypothetical protein ACRCXD_09835 [Luteolibacter sp.]